MLDEPSRVKGAGCAYSVPDGLSIPYDVNAWTVASRGRYEKNQAGRVLADILGSEDVA